MAGAAKELVDALIVNPNNIGEIYRAIIQGLEMPLEEQARRMKAMREVVCKFNIRHWVKIYMDRLSEVKQMQASLQTKFLNPSLEKEIEESYLNATKRILFLDYDGTLVGFQTDVNKASPDEELYRIFEQLAADPANNVVLISGRKHENLEEWFGHLKLNLIAEHGAWQKRKGHDWERVPGLTDSWKQDVSPILETFTDRTPGSFVEEKSYSLVWHYRRVQRELGELRANELMTNLRLYAGDKGLHILPGNKVVEIKNGEVNKGRAALSCLEKDTFDFILALGDDHTDEDLFKVLPHHAFSIKVGGSISAARYFLSNHKEVRRLLNALPSKSVISV
jgi:trehalose 6-phosphate synthase/phosphatase